jgi:NADH-quinone oxidoreductase subunit J
MQLVFYISSFVAVISTILVITRLNAIHALLYFIVSLLAVALIFFVLGAPFIAALEVIIYAGAIMVLFVFMIMLLNLGPQTVEQERLWLNPQMWIGPSILTVILLIELIYALILNQSQISAVNSITPKQVATSLFGPYVLGVELASILLLAGLVGAYHLSSRKKAKEQDEE